jgi:RimJ/RimL family protein N-acetyltransferase
MTHAPAPWLETMRLELREFTPDDIADLVRLDSDPRVLKYINGGRPMPRREIDAAMRRVTRYYPLYPGLGVWRASLRAIQAISIGSPTSDSSDFDPRLAITVGSLGLLGSRPTLRTPHPASSRT